MSDDLKDLQNLCAAYSVKFEDKGNGHIQLSAHGVLVNYWPLSKNRTVHFNGKTIKHCSNWDAIKLCMKNGELGLRPKKVTKNRAAFSLEPVSDNPAGIKHFYSGDKPPWEYPTFICAWSDIVRRQAHKLRMKADQMDSVETLQ